MNTDKRSATGGNPATSLLTPHSSPPTAVVFAYHNVGARCLRVLLANGVDVALVVTHDDNPNENIWFESVASIASSYGIPVATPEDPNSPGFVARLKALQPDFFFSFYYRQMLKPELLSIPKRGGYNMHGSLLPKYRGRVPVNWAVLHGEEETGATLHRMVEKPDAGEIVAQQAVPILPDDTAGDVFNKVTIAAEMALNKVLPQLLAGTATHILPDLARGSYFGGRKPEDGRIDWTRTAREIHNLIRAVAPPYPGAWCDVDGHRLVITGSLGSDKHHSHAGSARLCLEEGHLFAHCKDGGVVRILSLTLDGKSVDPASLPGYLGRNPIPLI